MRKLLVVLMALDLCLGLTGTAVAGDAAAHAGLAGTAVAGNVAAQVVTYQVDEINELSVSGNPKVFNVNEAEADEEPFHAEDFSTTYAITTNCGTDKKKITANIDTDMPANTTLKILIEPSKGASSPEGVDLTTGAKDVVNDIGPVVASGLSLQYHLYAAGVMPSSAQKAVTLTLTSQ